MSPRQTEIVVDPERTKISIKVAFGVLTGVLPLVVIGTVWVVTSNLDTATNAKAVMELKDIVSEGQKKDEERDRRYEIALATERADRKADRAELKTENQSLEKAIRDLNDNMLKIFNDSLTTAEARQWILEFRAANPALTVPSLVRDRINPR